MNHLRRLLGTTAIIVGLAAAPATASPAPATASATTTGDPSANRSLSGATYSSCSANPLGSSCITSALADINAAHAAEGVRALVLPTSFASMSVPVQLLNLANLERVDRGLAPIGGLSAPLDQDAQTAAAQGSDPMPTNFYGTEATSNWAGGFGSALEADFAWMYDDGLGSGNLDCTSSDQTGCWGHRHDILWRFSAPIAMGAGYATGRYGPSMTELFVGGDREAGPGQPDAPWVQPSLPGPGGGTSPGTPSAPPRPAATAQVGRVVPARGMVNVTVGCTGRSGSLCRLTFTLSVTTSRRNISVPLTVVLAPGQSKTVHVVLSRTGRRLRAAHHRLRARLVVMTGKSVVLARPLTLT